MTFETDPLWLKLEAFPLNDPDSPFPFTRRLAKENGWSLGFALRVTKEYKRFLYLAKRAGHVVSPSDEVDQAWHLHLVYTRSYWDELCAGVLEGPLHHGPTRGGQEETVKYRDLYGRTLASYERLFDAAPPADIWPDVDQRFISDGLRVRRRDVWIVPKPWRRKR